jgi:hypothetical protein
MKKLFLFAASLVLLTTTVVAQEKFDYGTFKGNTYSNAFFKLSVTLPEEWVVQSAEFSKKMKDLGAERIAGDDEGMRKALEKAIEQTGVLITVFKYEVGSPVDYNPSFIIITENVKLYPGIKKGSDYLFNVKKMLKGGASGSNYTIDNDFKQENIDGRDFYVMHVLSKTLGNEVIQDYYSTIKDGYAVSFILTYINEAQKDELNGIKNTFDFK